MRAFLAVFVAALTLSAFPSLAQPPGTTTQLIDDGAWTWFNDPRAVCHDGRLYTSWITSTGDVQLHQLTPTSGQQRLVSLHPNFQRDDHNNPGLLPNPDGSISAFYTQHNTSVPVLTRTVSIGAGGSLTMGPESRLTHPNDSLVGTTAGWTYANPYRLTSPLTGASKTYVFSRGTNFNPVYRVRDDATGTWGAQTKLIQNGSQRPYVKYHSNNADRIGFAFTDGHPRNVTNNVYYAYTDGSAYYRVDGTKIKDMSAGHLTPADMGGTGTVFDDSANSWIWDVAHDAAGNPVMTYSVYPDLNDQAGRHDYHYARWTGAEWIDVKIAQNIGGTIAVPGEGHYAGGVVLDPTDPSIVYASVADGTGGRSLLQLKTPDGGMQWDVNLIAQGNGPTLENIRPYVPLNRPAGTEMVLWMSGQYDWWDFSANRGVGYDTSIMLWTNPVPEPGGMRLTILGATLLLRRRRP